MKNPLILVYKVYGIQNDRLDLTINSFENAVSCKSVKWKPNEILQISLAMMHSFSNWFKLINDEIKTVILIDEFFTFHLKFFVKNL